MMVHFKFLVRSIYLMMKSTEFVFGFYTKDNVFSIKENAFICIVMQLFYI
jgi:hypothetical protein